MTNISTQFKVKVFLFFFLCSLLLPETDTVVDVGAVVVELGDTTVTDAAVLGSEGPVKEFSFSITFTKCFANSGLEYRVMSTIVDLLWAVRVNVLNLTERQVWQRRRMSGPASSEAFAANKKKEINTDPIQNNNIQIMSHPCDSSTHRSMQSA